MKVAICDDEPIVRNLVKEMCLDYFKLNLLEVNIFMFKNGVEFLKNNMEMDIVFIDVDMPKLNGLSVAEKIRYRGENSFIIFLTGYSEMMQNAFKVKAFRYLLKPVKKYEIFEALEAIQKEVLEDKKIVISYKNVDTIISEQDILSIESLGDHTSIYLYDKYHISTNTLAYWSEILDKTLFFRTHKSYIVGISHVRKIDKKSVFLINNMEVPISVRNMKKFKERINNYIRLKAR